MGRTEQREDAITAAPLAGFIALLDRADEAAPTIGSTLPPLAHWLYFLPKALQRDIDVDVDGHPHRGDFLPAVALPRRMWAGGRISFDHALRIGDMTTRQSTISRIEVKEGRSDALVFVMVAHEISQKRGIAVREEHDIVYRDHPNPTIARFDFKAVSPLFDIDPFTVCGKHEADGSVALWARNHLGHLAMTAHAVLA